MIRKIAASLLLALLATGAYAQSSPGLYNGQVPTAAQWNSYFAAKQDVLGFVPLNRAGGTMAGKLVTAVPTTSAAGFNLPPGTAPTSPVDGDMWTTTAGTFVRINGVTQQLLASGTLIGSTLNLQNPSATTPTITLGATGNVGTTTRPILIDPSAITGAGNYKFAVGTYTAFGFSNGPMGQTNYIDGVAVTGWNVNSSGQRIDNTLPASYLQHENKFYQSGCFGYEFHLEFISATGTSFRPMGSRECYDGSQMAFEFGVDQLHVGNSANTTDIALFDTISNAITIGSGTVIRAPLNNSCPLQQQNAASSGYDCLISLNGSDQIQIDRPFAGITGPFNITSPAALTGGASIMSLSSVSGSAQAQSINVSFDASVTIDDILKNTGTGLTRRLTGATANDAVSIYSDDATRTWIFGVDHSDSGALVLSLGNGLGTNNALRADPTTLLVAGTYGILSQNQCSANSGSTNNSASGSGAFVLMTPNCALPANAITSGRSFVVYMTFQFTTGSAVPVFTWELRAGSTVLAHFDPGALTVSQTNRTVTYAIKVQGTAAPGAAAPVVAAALTTPNQTNGITGNSNATAQPVNLATNGGLTLQAATQWATAGTGTNTVTLLDMTVQWMN